jgi:hypothetical protein
MLGVTYHALSKAAAARVGARRGLASARYAAAEAALGSLPELQAARETPDASAAYGHLKRALDVVSNVGDRKLVVVAHGHLARLCYSVGRPDVERSHRVAAIDALLQEDADARDDGEPAALLAAAYNGLALSCLRVSGAESALAAGAAAASAEAYARSAPMRLAASLHAGLARPAGSDAQRLLLSAVARLDVAAEPGEVDVAGWADFFLAVNGVSDGGGPGDERALARMRGLLARWDERDDFDLVEAQCAAARELVRRGPDGAGANATGLDEAEGLLTVALKSAERLGNKLDMSEPVLGLAQLYAAKRLKVEAEGMFRSVEDRFAGLKERHAFTVLTAEVYCRALEQFAHFLGGVGRDAEAASKRKDANEVRAQFPAILGTSAPPVPLWFVDSCIEHYAVPPVAML